MEIALSEELTKYHGQKVKTAVVSIPGKGRISLALSDTARCAHMMSAARNTLKNLAGDPDLEDEDVEAAAQQLHVHCRRLSNLPVEPEQKRRR